MKTQRFIYLCLLLHTLSITAWGQSAPQKPTITINKVFLDEATKSVRIHLNATDAQGRPFMDVRKLSKADVKVTEKNQKMTSQSLPA